MNNSLYLYLSQYRLFWLIRSLFNKLVFWGGAEVFHHQSNTREKRDNLLGLRHLFKITQIQLFLAILVAMIIQLVDPFVYDFYKLESFNIPDDSDYVTFLVTISGIGGVFIGLYYAAISTIGSSIYAKVPNNIRDLLTTERVGNVYMHFLSFITILSLTFVSFRILGFDRLYLAIPIMLTCGGVGIIAFVKLGQRAFYFFDPTALSINLYAQLRQHIKMTKAGGYRWNDAAFQRHANKLANQSLDTLKTLTDITKNEVHLRGAPFISLSKNLITFLLFYEKSKKCIPSSSQWYEEKYVHRDWYRTDDSRVSIAHQTGTTLHPDITNNKEWVEENVLPIILDCLEINLKEERYNEVLGLIEYIDAYLTLLARNARADHAFEILEMIGKKVLETISPEVETELVTEEVLEKLAVIERISMLPITIAISCREYIEEINSEIIRKRLLKIDWNNDVDIYRNEFASYSLPRLEWFKSKLSFEKKSEGKIVTPIWYQKELLLQIESDVYVDNVNSIIYKGKDLFSNWINKTISAKHPWLAGAVMSNEWEFWHKVDHQMEIWPDKWAELSDGKNIEGLPWSNFDIEKLKDVSKCRQSELLKLMSTQSIMLAFPDQPEGFPDYSGQFLHTSGEISFDSLLTNNHDLLKNVFTKYLYGCLMRFDKLRPGETSTDWRAQQEIKIAAAPLLDVIELSGYAKLMADYHDNVQLWQVIVDSWDEYIKDKVGASPLPLFAASISLTEGGFEIPHRGALRSNWEIRINRKLSEVPRHEDYSRRSFGSDTVIEHDSPLIRIFAREPYGSFHDGIDIFITYYLRTKDETEQLEFGRRRRDLQDSIDRETAKDDQRNA
jgi:hypothetical protein